MAKKIPPNHPRSETGVALFDWICDGEKFDLVYPDDYLDGDLEPATNVLDINDTYSLAEAFTPPVRGEISETPGGPTVPAVQLTPLVEARLNAGGNINDDQIIEIAQSWDNTTPYAKIVQDIRKLISDGKVDY